MNVLAFAAATAVTSALWVPTAVFYVECAFGLLPPRRTRTQGSRPKIVVVVPAHDEERGIAETLATIRPELQPGDRLLVVADNCTDRTADVARDAGAEVAVRGDPSRRGKGYAISFALDALAESPPEVVVLVDADCRVEPGALARIATLSWETGRPVQADYVLSAPPGASVRTRVSAFALIVRNRIRPRGLARLGLPCQLTGSGMAFPWHVLRKAAPPGGNIVEDLALGLDLAEKGHPPLFCPDALVESFLPLSESGAVSQRRRWESGQLATLRRKVPRLLGKGILNRRLDLVALGLDLAVPPLSLLVASVSAGTVLAAGASLTGAGPIPVILGIVQSGALASAVLGGWIVFGRKVLPIRDALGIPRYVAWKLGLFRSFLHEGAEREWVRTERDHG